MKIFNPWVFTPLFFIAFVNILLIATPFVNYLYAVLEVDEAPQKCDAIVLLSGGQFTDDILDRNTYQRLLHAYDLLKQGYTDKIIICGGIVGKRENKKLTIAESIQKVMVELGVPENQMILEKNSQNTFESIVNVKKMTEANINKFLVVTSSYHMFRSIAIAKKQGMDVYPAPVPCYEKNVRRFGARTRLTYDIIREYGAICYFWFKGWI